MKILFKTNKNKIDRCQHKKNINYLNIQKKQRSIDDNNNKKCKFESCF